MTPNSSRYPHSPRLLRSQEHRIKLVNLVLSSKTGNYSNGVPHTVTQTSGPTWSSTPCLVYPPSKKAIMTVYQSDNPKPTEETANPSHDAADSLIQTRPELPGASARHH